MSHAKHLFKGQPLCRRWPFAQTAGPIGHCPCVSGQPLTRAVSLLWSSGAAGSGGHGGGWGGGFGTTCQFTVESGKLLSEPLDARPVPPLLSVLFWSELSQLVWAGMLHEEAPVSPTLPCPLAGYRFSFFIGAQRPELTQCPFTLQRSMPRCLQHTVSLSFSFGWLLPLHTPPPPPPSAA